MNDKFGYRIAPATNTRVDRGPELPNYLKTNRTLITEPGKVKNSAPKPIERYAYASAQHPRPRPNGRTGGNGGSGSGNTPRPPRRKKKNRAKAVLIAAVSLLCLMLGVLVFIFLSEPPSNPISEPDVAETPGDVLDNPIQADSGKFYEGVSVDGIDIGNLTYAEAHSKVMDAADEKLGAINFKLTLEDKEYTLNRDDIKADVDADSVLKEAFNVGRDGSVLQNLDAQNKVKSEGASFNTELTFDESALREKLEEIGKEARVEPVEPTAVVNKGEGDDRFKYEPGKDGKEADIEALLDEIESRISEGELSGDISIPTKSIPPTHTLEQVKNNTKKIDSATTFFKSSTGRKPDRVFNIDKASGIINGAEIKPGDEWSFNEFVGPRTLKGGWKEAPGIVNGNMYEMQAGGGICQVSTTLYNAVLKADIEIVSSKRHSWPSSYVEYGLDATVSTGGPDLVIRNNKDYSIFLFSSVNTKDRSITVSVYGPNTNGEGVKIELHSKVIEEKAPPEPEIIEDPLQPVGYKETIIEARSGYTCEVYRNFVKDGEILKTEKMYSHKYRTVKGTLRIGTGNMTELEPVPQNPELAPEQQPQEPQPQPQEPQPQEPQPQPQESQQEVSVQ